MTEKFDLYRCKICGNLIEVLLTGADALVCCGEDMEQIEAKNSTDDNGLSEKHSPVIEYTEENKRTIRVNTHPMEKEHYIMFLETISQDGNEAKIKFLYPEQEAVMDSGLENNEIYARSYCNIHGLYNDNKKEE